MRALIFGITGQDGAYLAQFLLKRGYEVWGASRDAHRAHQTNLDALGITDSVKIISTTLHDFRSVLSCMDLVAPEEIYNLAGQSSVSLSFQEPVETMNSICSGTLHLLECIRYRRAATKLYSAGSSECFGELQGTAADEQTAFRPRSPYGVAKAAAHWQVVNYRESYDIFACNGVLFNHESPLRPKQFVTRKVIAAAAAIGNGSSAKLRLGNTTIVRDWGWAPEYVEAMWRMLQNPTPEDFVIATGESHSLQEFVEAAFACIGKESAEFVEQDNNLLRPSEIMYSAAKPEKAARILGWSAKNKMRDVVRLMLEAE